MDVRSVTTNVIGGGPLRDRLLAQAAGVAATLPVHPRLVIVQVGEHAPSDAYIRNKLAASNKAGIEAELVRLREDDGEGTLHRTVKALAGDTAVHAIVVQTPLPAGWRVQAVLDLVPPTKDVDGLASANMALRRAGDARALLPATPLGVMRLLEHLGVGLPGCQVAVVGRGMVVGAPLREMLEAAGARVIAIDKATAGPEALAGNADVLVSAAGVPGLITAAWVKPGAVVIDVGLTRVGHRLMGDVARAEVEGVAGVLTPVPGGVGPMTVASLLTNVIDAACLQLGRERVAWHLDAAYQPAHRSVAIP